MSEPASGPAPGKNSPSKQAAAAVAPAPPPLPPPRLTRTAVARRLGCSVSKVRTLEGKALHPLVEGGVHTFAAAQVEALAATIPRRARAGDRGAGAQAAAVFRLFDAGKDLRVVVEELGVEPEQVRALYRQWRVPDLEEGERQRQRAERAAAEERELERASRLSDKQAREHERQMNQIMQAMLATGAK
jgi:hypothetical protein